MKPLKRHSSVIQIVFAFLFMLGAACNASADGVTIVTHGWHPSSGSPAWLESMRHAISNNHLEAEQNYGIITVTQSGSSLLATCDPWNFDLNSGVTGEILIILDWSSVANHLTGGPPAQEVAALVIDKIVTAQNGKAPLAELPIHLIGHSRGGGMICDIARLLGEKGIIVDHLTPLDPHPLTSSDPQPFLGTTVIDTPAAVYENVLFADVYLQNVEYPEGEAVSGAWNRTWGTMAGGYYDNDSPYPNHRNIYLMYQGTVDLNNPVNNGEASMDAEEREAWFTGEEAGGDQTGFGFSRIKGTVARENEGLHADTLFGGTGSRQALSWNEAVWPNIAVLQVSKDDTPLGHGSHTVPAGTILDLGYVAMDHDTSSTVTLHLDADRNPYNNNDLAAIGDPVQHAATGAAFIEKTVSWDTGDIPGGTTAHVYAKISDGTRTRYFYAPAQLIIPDTASCQANAGWNLLSLYLDPLDPSIEKILAGIEDNVISVWKWVNGNWAVYLPGDGDDGEAYAGSKGFSKMTEIHCGEGFWINSATSQALTYDGMPPADTSCLLKKGWNLTGLKVNEVTSVSELIANNPDQIISLWKWVDGKWAVSLPGQADGGAAYAKSKGFSLLSDIAPGEGFWVNCVIEN
jgi:hypothetical protein